MQRFPWPAGLAVALGGSGLGFLAHLLFPAIP